jgi:hypothetical protein
VKTTNKENWCQFYLANEEVYMILAKVDADFAQKVQEGGCVYCEGALHRSDYPRKPRGGPEMKEEVYRDSFCCNQDGCRKRHTPASVRFLGRKIYWGVIVVLVSALRQGLKPERVETLHRILGVDRRTLEHWRAWWLETFVRSSFWKMARAGFMPVLCEKTLPSSLCDRFEIVRLDRLLALLEFLSPITTTSFPVEITLESTM